MSILDNGSDDIKELLNNLIRIGKVSSVDYQRGTARVTFPDDDEIVSYNLPVLHRNALKNKDYNMPDVDERVLCLFLPSGVATGFILGSVYTDTVKPPEATGNYRTVVFADGTRVRYDREKHELSAEIAGTTIFANRQDITINTPNDVIVTAANAVTVTGTNAVTVNTKAATVNTETAAVTASGNVAISSAKGNISVAAAQGEVAITAGGDNGVSINAKQVIASGDVKAVNLFYKSACAKE